MSKIFTKGQYSKGGKLWKIETKIENSVYGVILMIFFRPIYNSDQYLATMKTDIRETKDKYVIEIDLPGFDRKDIDITIDDGYLTISAEKNTEKESKDKKGSYLRKERHYGICSRSFYIGEIDESFIKAEYNSGTLTLAIPKKEIKSLNKKHIEIE